MYTAQSRSPADALMKNSFPEFRRELVRSLPVFRMTETKILIKTFTACRTDALCGANVKRFPPRALFLVSSCSGVFWKVKDLLGFRLKLFFFCFSVCHETARFNPLNESVLNLGSIMYNGCCVTRYLPCYMLCVHFRVVYNFYIIIGARI